MDAPAPAWRTALVSGVGVGALTGITWIVVEAAQVSPDVARVAPDILFNVGLVITSICGFQAGKSTVEHVSRVVRGGSKAAVTGVVNEVIDNIRKNSAAPRPRPGSGDRPTDPGSVPRS